MQQHKLAHAAICFYVFVRIADFVRVEFAIDRRLQDTLPKQRTDFASKCPDRLNLFLNGTRTQYPAHDSQSLGEYQAEVNVRLATRHETDKDQTSLGTSNSISLAA